MVAPLLSFFQNKSLNILRLKLKKPIVLLILIVFSLFVLILTVDLLNQQSNLLLEGKINDWGYKTVQKTRHYINTLDPFLIPHEFCKRTALLIMVHSEPSNFRRRLAIRRTWADRRYTKGYNTSVYFLLGQSDKKHEKELREEVALFGDIIQCHLVDSKINGTLKSIAMLKMIVECSTAEFVLKVKDDVFVNSAAISEHLRQVRKDNASVDLLEGELFCERRKSNSQWYEKRKYPSYVSGAAYLMSSTVARKLYETSLETTIFHLEDVYITGICAQRAKIKPRHNGAFSKRQIKRVTCSLANFYTIHDIVDPYTMDSLQENALIAAGKTEILCPLEETTYAVTTWILHSLLMTKDNAFSYRQWCK